MTDNRKLLVTRSRLGKSEQCCLRESREAALVDPRLHIAVPNPFEINHRRGDIAMSHPLLQGADVDTVLEVARGVSVTEFVKEPAATVRSFGTAIYLYSPLFQFVAHGAMTAVQFSAKRDCLKFF